MTRSALFWLLAGALGSNVIAADIVLRVSGKPIPMFEYSKDRCDGEDIPDSTARAFRDAKGAIHLFSTHYVNRAMVGPNFDQLKRECNVVYKGAGKDNPAEFNDKSWLMSTYTSDGRTVYGLFHNEFQGHTRPAMCPSKSYVSCWYNSIFLAKSEDAGQSFRRVREGADSVIVAPASRYVPDAGRRIGPASPGNIIFHNDYYHFLFVSEGDRVCIARTKDITNPRSWLIWDGSSFSIDTKNPYSTAEGSTQQCPHLKGLLPGSSGTIVFHQKSGTFILVQIGGPKANPAGAGMFYLLSKDLVNWTVPELLWQVPARVPENCDTPYVYGYPALIDPASSSRNFDVTGDRPWLLTTRRRFQNCQGTMERDLLKVQVVIQ